MTLEKLKLHGQFLHAHLLAGTSNTQNERRHEFILNVMLLSVVLACLISGIFALIDYPVNDELQQGNTLLNIMVLMIIMTVLWWISRAGHYVVSAYLFLACISGVTFSLALTWSFELPTVGLGCAVLVVIAGLVLEARTSLKITIITVAGLLLIGHLQVTNRLHPNVTWLNKPLRLSNAVDYDLLLSVIGLVSWLANLEIDRSLEQARVLAKTLAEERDSLEIKVCERTRELEQTQHKGLVEMQRFAEFGRLSAHLLHEVATPLTAASLNLEQLGWRQSQALRQARYNLKQMERYIHAARKQLQNQSQQTEFNASAELYNILTVLQPLARKARVKLIITSSAKPIKIVGNPIKFNQIVTNLAINAIESYGEIGSAESATSRRVTITLDGNGQHAVLTVQDWGVGITDEQLPRLFEPFYTTKFSAKRGLGMGLAMVRQSVKQDFDGDIIVNSSNGCTSFTVKLRLRCVPSTCLPPIPGKRDVRRLALGLRT